MGSNSLLQNHYVAIIKLSSLTGEFILNVTQFKLGLKSKLKLKISVYPQ